MIIGVKERGIPAAVAAERHVVQTDAKAIDSGSPRRCRIIRRMSLGRSDQLGLGLCPAKVKKQNYILQIPLILFLQLQ